jgi:plastocyanin
MKTIDRLSTVITLSTLILVLAAYTLPATAAEYRSDGWKSQSTGRVVGTVWLVGAYEKPAPLKVFKNRDFCGPWVANESLLVNRDGGVRNVVIVLRPTGREARVQPASIILDNRNCAFTPHVQVATVGSQLQLKNSDPILHAVHARLSQETLFNVGLPRWRQVTKTLTRSGIIRINCDVLHTWMSAAIVVTESPYYAVTDQRGRFMIDQLPAGDYEMEIWQEKLGSRNRRLMVFEGAETSVDVVYRPNQKTP